MYLSEPELSDTDSEKEEENIFSDIEGEHKDINLDIKCCFCSNCPYPKNMLDTINFDGKMYKVCDTNKISLYNKLVNENNNKVKTYISGTNEFINDDIFNIEKDIFEYKIFNDYFMINNIKKCIELDKNNGLNSNKYYLDFIYTLPWTKELDYVLNKYTSCHELMENHFRKTKERPNITFCNVPIRYNKYYYEYILWATECIECQKNDENNCLIYNKIINFLNKKIKNN